MGGVCEYRRYFVKVRYDLEVTRISVPSFHKGRQGFGLKIGSK